MLMQEAHSVLNFSRRLSWNFLDFYALPSFNFDPLSLFENIYGKIKPPV